MRIAVAGNPNSGKTTLFNAITGANAHVANYPGVTVERREASVTLPGGASARVVDLPGCYSLTARSPEEEIAHEVLMGRIGDPRPDVVLCVVDATNLGRGLYLVQQVLELELPVIMALNMIDLAREQGLDVDIDALSLRLGVPVIATSGRLREGIPELLGAFGRGPPSRNGHDRTAWLVPSGAEASVIAGVGEALKAAKLPTAMGERLWWLTSDLDHLAGRTLATTDASLLAAVGAARAELARSSDGRFNRRVIEGRYRAVDALLDGVLHAHESTLDDPGHRLDRVLLHPVWGMTVFIAAMIVLFQTVFAWADPLIGAVEHLIALLGVGIEAVVPEGLVRSLLVNGVVAGIGNVLVFLPQIALLFLGLTLLEESGYMARAAFLLDSLMRRVGLHGKSFVPLMSSFACAVPGIMATRTVESSRDRLVTIFIAPFMSCSARLPVYTLVIGAVFATAPPVLGVFSAPGLLIAAMYFLGFFAAIGTAWLLKRSVLRAPPPPFLLELPPYRRPLAREVVRQVVLRCRVFITQTGTVILAISLVLWALMSFPRHGLDPQVHAAELVRAQALAGSERDAALAHLERLEREQGASQLEHSIAGRIGHLIEPVIEPLGFDWRIGIGLVASFAAREVLVSTLGQVYALDADVDADSPALRDALLADRDPKTGEPLFSPLVGLSLMVFFVLAMQCMSTLATVKRETNSWRWPIAQLLYMNTLAYVASLVVYQGGSLLGLG